LVYDAVWQKAPSTREIRVSQTVTTINDSGYGAGSDDEVTELLAESIAADRASRSVSLGNVRRASSHRLPVAAVD
jgi:hypothetical protein